MQTARKRVARVMAADGLQGRSKRRFKKTTIPDANNAADLWTDLVARDFNPTRLVRMWSATEKPTTRRLARSMTVAR